MEIDKEQIQEIINRMEASEQPFYDACQMLKELINPKWEPMTSISEYNQKIHDAYFAMEERNKRIMLAKLEKGFGEGQWIISYSFNEKEWRVYKAITAVANPEITFETEGQAEEVIRMCRLNES